MGHETFYGDGLSRLKRILLVHFYTVCHYEKVPENSRLLGIESQGQIYR